MDMAILVLIFMFLNIRKIKKIKSIEIDVDILTRNINVTKIILKIERILLKYVEFFFKFLKLEERKVISEI